jgi:hypothetical protein
MLALLGTGQRLSSRADRAPAPRLLPRDALLASLTSVQGERSERGRRTIAWSWGTTALFAGTALPVTLGASRLEGVAIVVSLTLFAASLAVWAYAFGLAVVRSSRGDDVTVPALFFLSSGTAPPTIRRQLVGALAVSVVVAVVTVKANPFSALVPMLALGLVGLWAARHGTFPPRRTVAGVRNNRDNRAVISRRSDGRSGQ